MSNLKHNFRLSLPKTFKSTSYVKEIKDTKTETKVQNKQEDSFYGSPNKSK